MYTILEKEFKNKNAIIDECRNIVERNIDKELKGDDYNFIIEVLKNHPNWKIKSKGLESIKVMYDKYELNYCLWLKKQNGTYTDVSYHRCVKYIKVVSSINIDLILPFGKHKGKSIYDINDENYLKWLVDLPNLSRDLKVKIGQFLRYGYIPYNPIASAYNKKQMKNK
jgi:hypothetical protein